MEMDGFQDKTGTLENHNRLDQILGTENFTSQWCGSEHLTTGKPHYCCFECPVLSGKEQKQQDDPKAAEVARLQAQLAALTE